MTNEVTLFADKSEVPSYLVTKETSSTTRNLAGSGGLKWISIKGSVFRMKVGSQEVAINEDRAMKFVIVGSAPALARTLYPAYVEGANSSPICWSDDGVAPSPHCEDKQAMSCAVCPQNIKGSGSNGSRACKYSARIAVVLEGNIGGDVFGMSIPAQSLFGEGNGTHSPLQEYARKLAGYNISVEKVVTEFKFDPASPVPKLWFRAIRPLTEAEYRTVQATQTTPDPAQHIGPRKFEALDEEGDEPMQAADKVKEEPAPSEPKVRKSGKTPVNVEDTLKEWANAS
jgi:hypothetical protein